MYDVDDLIDLIDERRLETAMRLLESAHELAVGHSERESVLRGATPLHWAAHRNAAELCRRLVELRADADDASARWWRTPLAWAADAGSAEAVQALLELGADVDADAYGGTSALHAAAQGGSSSGQRDPEAYRRTAQTLIAHGAIIERRAEGDRGQTPLEDALRAGNEAVAQVLRESGARG